MIKLIATDIDGTLIKDGTLAINPEYMTVIRKLREKGILFVACSGRQFSSEQKVFAPIKDELLYVTDGGTVVRTPKEILKVYAMPDDIWKQMCVMVRNEMPDCDYFIATPDCCYAEDGNSRMFNWLRDSYGYHIYDAHDLLNFKDKNVIKFSVYHPTACEAACAPYFTPFWKDKVCLVPAGNEWVDCTLQGVSKNTSIEFIQNYYGIAPEETCTFGDNLNDIEMLAHSGLSFAVANAREEVRVAAKDTCPPYWENGVLQILKKFL